MNDPFPLLDVWLHLRHLDSGAAMMVICECNGPWQWRPGVFRSTVGGVPFHRIWWGPFALAWTSLSLPAYHALVVKGDIEWRVSSPLDPA